MALDPQTKAFLLDVRESITAAAPKGGFFSRLVGKGQPALDEETVLSGLKVNGYQIKKVLGQGAAGVVFGATDEEGEEVAIKVIPKPAHKDQDAVALFEREVKIGQKLSHPAVVHTLRTFEFGPAQFVVMERVNGTTLASVLLERLEVAKFLSLFEPLVQGLQAAHDEGVVHRDLKPENVMLSEQGEVKILDFGMARLVQDASVTATGVFKGTIRYTSPEQIQDSKRVGPATDQFSLGLMMFEALTGKFPYELQEKQPMVTLMARVSGQAVNLREVDPEYTEETAGVLAKMLSSEPDRRYGSVSEAFDALKLSLG
jgi:serine/threonine-protein kinase